jgi:hypothetical protein
MGNRIEDSAFGASGLQRDKDQALLAEGLEFRVLGRFGGMGFEVRVYSVRFRVRFIVWGLGLWLGLRAQGLGLRV